MKPPLWADAMHKLYIDMYWTCLFGIDSIYIVIIDNILLPCSSAKLNRHPR